MITKQNRKKDTVVKPQNLKRKKLLNTLMYAGSGSLLTSSIVIPLSMNAIRVTTEQNTLPLSQKNDLVANVNYAAPLASKSFDLNLRMMPNIENAKRASTIENRAIEHSNWIPTGIFAEEQKPIFINKLGPDGLPFKAVVGQWGTYPGVNDGKSFGPETFDISTQDAVIVPKHSGMLYFWNPTPNPITVRNVSGEGLTKAATFEVNKTNIDSFINDIKTTTCPIVELTSRRAFITFLTSDFTKVLNDNPITGLRDLNERLIAIDQTIDMEDKFWGLSKTDSGRAHRFDQLVHIASSDESTEAFGIAYEGRIAYYRPYGGVGGFLTSSYKYNFLFWHELGHTYSIPDLLWSGTTESINDIFTTYISDLWGTPWNQGDISQLRTFLALPDDQRSFDKASDVVKRLLFYQLTMAFGENFYAHLANEYRLLDPFDRKYQVAEIKERFITLASKVANRNLLPLFKKWGLEISAKAESDVRAMNLPELKNEIWNNRLVPAPIIENHLPELIPTLGDFSATQALDFGRAYSQSELDKAFSKSPNVNEIYPDYNSLDKVNGKWSILTYGHASSPYFDDNALVANTPINMGKVIRFWASYTWLRGYVAVDETNKRINFYGNRTQLSTSFGNNNIPYASIKIVDENNVVQYEINAKANENLNEVFKRNGVYGGISYKPGWKLLCHCEQYSRVWIYDQKLDDFTNLPGWYDVTIPLN